MRTIILKKLYLFFGVLAAFYKFHWTSKFYAALIYILLPDTFLHHKCIHCVCLLFRHGVHDMGNRFLGVQISIISVVFAVKTVTILWQPAKAQDIPREFHSSTVICCWNLLSSHYDYQRTSAGLENKHSTPDTWLVEAVYRHKNCLCLCVWQGVCSCTIDLKRVWLSQL